MSSIFMGLFQKLISFWPVPDSAHMGRQQVKLHLWLITISITSEECTEHAPTTTLFTGTSDMEKWDLMSYVQQSGNVTYTEAECWENQVQSTEICTGSASTLSPVKNTRSPSHHTHGPSHHTHSPSQHPHGPSHHTLRSPPCLVYRTVCRI